MGPASCAASVAQLVERFVRSIECRGFESHLRRIFFLGKVSLGCAVLLCLVCLFALACFFLSSFSHLSLNMYIVAHTLACIHTYTLCQLTLHIRHLHNTTYTPHHRKCVHSVYPITKHPILTLITPHSSIHTLCVHIELGQCERRRDWRSGGRAKSNVDLITLSHSVIVIACLRRPGAIIIALATLRPGAIMTL